MNLYLLSQAAMDYGQTFVMLVAAPSEDMARLTAGRDQRSKGSSAAFEWVDPDITEAKLIGSATEGTDPAVLMTKESAG